MFIKSETENIMLVKKMFQCLTSETAHVCFDKLKWKWFLKCSYIVLVMEQTETDKKQTKRVKLKSESELSSSLNTKFCMR